MGYLIESFEEFLNENRVKDYKTNKNEYTKEGYTFYDGKGIGRNPTRILKLKPEAWDRVEHLFDSNGKAKINELQGIKVNDDINTWTLYAQSVKTAGGMRYQIYGVSGDFTFGNAPAYYNSRYAGNKKAAIKILSMFIEKYLK